MRIATSFLALAALVAAVPACSSSPPSGSGAPSGNFDPGVSTSKLVDDMSDAEVTTFCNAGREYTGGVIARLDPMPRAK